MVLSERYSRRALDAAMASSAAIVERGCWCLLRGAICTTTCRWPLRRTLLLLAT